ncbi:hypothetical protein D9756_007045 [Leucocoprinus leucothites]|uniref:Transmembrane protein n=1 Tax=Leucocoprinus leucothites TaxID=201217 RepID=A0A8H5D635_9AGAR|nr:hypothetical protein D9756_007045 [Leucoagaricus leucothites]
MSLYAPNNASARLIGSSCSIALGSIALRDVLLIIYFSSRVDMLPSGLVSTPSSTRQQQRQPCDLTNSLNENDRPDVRGLTIQKIRSWIRRPMKKALPNAGSNLRSRLRRQIRTFSFWLGICNRGFVYTAAIWSLKHKRWEMLGLTVQFCCFTILLATFQLRCVWFCRKVFGLRSTRWKLFAAMAFMSALTKAVTVSLVTYASISKTLEASPDPLSSPPILIARGCSIFLNTLITLSCSLHVQAFVAQMAELALVAKCWYTLASLSTACNITMFVLFQLRGGLALAHLPLTLAFYEISRTALDFLEDHIAIAIEEEETRTVAEITTVLSDDASEMFEMPRRIHVCP